MIHMKLKSNNVKHIKECPFYQIWVIFLSACPFQTPIMSVQLFFSLIDTHWHCCAFFLPFFHSFFLPVAWAVDLAVQGCKYHCGFFHSHTPRLYFTFTSICKHGRHMYQATSVLVELLEPLLHDSILPSRWFILTLHCVLTYISFNFAPVFCLSVTAFFTGWSNFAPSCSLFKNSEGSNISTGVKVKVFLNFFLFWQIRFKITNEKSLALTYLVSLLFGDWFLIFLFVYFQLNITSTYTGDTLLIHFTCVLGKIN